MTSDAWEAYTYRDSRVDAYAIHYVSKSIQTSTQLLLNIMLKYFSRLTRMHLCARKLRSFAQRMVTSCSSGKVFRSSCILGILLVGGHTHELQFTCDTNQLSKSGLIYSAYRLLFCRKWPRFRDFISFENAAMSPSLVMSVGGLLQRHIYSIPFDWGIYL